MKKFEYMTLTAGQSQSLLGGQFELETLHDQINEYGEQGWELLSVTPITEGYGKTHMLLYMLKREKI